MLKEKCVLPSHKLPAKAPEKMAQTPQKEAGSSSRTTRILGDLLYSFCGSFTATSFQHQQFWGTKLEMG